MDGQCVNDGFLFYDDRGDIDRMRFYNIRRYTTDTKVTEDLLLEFPNNAPYIDYKGFYTYRDDDICTGDFSFFARFAARTCVNPNRLMDDNYDYNSYILDCTEDGSWIMYEFTK